MIIFFFFQALRGELQQQIGSHSNNTSGSKTAGTSQRKTVTPSISSGSSVQLKSPRIPCSLTSPAPSQSARKSVSPWLQQKTSEWPNKSVESVSNLNTGSEVCVSVMVQQVGQMSANVQNANSAKNVKSGDSWIKEERKRTGEDNLASSQVKEALTVSVVNINAGDNIEEFDNYKPMSTESICEAKTPENSMETDQAELSHVRKIDFDDIVGQNKFENFPANDTNAVSEKSNNGITKNSAAADINESSADKLSKSTGCLSLKKMLENKPEEKACLNKSMGHLGKSKTTLFVNQSTVPGRSAFVPFSQVQSLCRKEGTGVNQSVAMAIPIIIPSAAQTQSSQTVSQSASFTMIALPTEMHTSPTKNPSELINNEPLFNIVPASAVFKQQVCEGKTDLTFQTAAIDSSKLPLNFQNQTKESTSVVTVTSVMSKTTGSECIVSSAQTFQNLPKQLRTKFTPIRPKASPNKAQTQPQKDVKADIPTYGKDKRPVSAILKEKRAKEQAEAIAKFQSSIQLPYQQNISVTGQQLSTLQGLQAGSSNIPPSEVVIIVNNQPVKLQQVSQTCQNSVPDSVGVNSDIAPKEQAKQVVTDAEKTAVGQEKGDVIYDLVSCESNVNQSKISTTSVSSSISLNLGNEDYEIGSNSSEAKVFSPMSEERDVTPILCEDDEDDNELNDNFNTTDSNLNITGLNNENRITGLQTNRSGKMSSDLVDQMWIETPRKIQKLNIKSPFQEDISNSLGRETPVRISQPSDLSLSRPESADSYGRETPSGARKRKSSDFHARQNFKRLNSTGEENEQVHNLSFVLSPENDLSANLNPRRTQSCTMELDPDTKVKYQSHRYHQQQQQLQQQQTTKAGSGSLLPGLQSPDIHSLEREALIESFPNSLYAMKPQHKLHKTQSSSIGVSARSLRQSQQKLIKQQQDLDERVKHFLQMQNDTSLNVDIDENSGEPVTKNKGEQKTSQISPGSKASLKADSFVVSDRGKPYQRPNSVTTVGNRMSNLDIEPSGLPSDVADWINETIEKRQKENQSVMSEPEFRNYQSMKAGRNSKLPNFKFEVDQSISGKKINTGSQGKTAKDITSSKTASDSTNNDHFTVPKAPPVSNTRMKENLRLNTDISSVSQRCQSLPIFASPVQSPVSPMAPPGTHIHGNQRASSMSPRGQIPDQSAEMLSPTSFGLLSPVKRRELREAVHKESKQGTYLASIQHSLQKPVDTPHDVISPQDSSFGKHPLPGGKNMNPLHNRSRESSIDGDERYVSKTPFSDSGYHSCGPSPILNSTPVSAADNSEIVYGHGRSQAAYKPSIAESPITMVTDFTSPVQQLSPHQSQMTIHQQNVSIATSQMNNLGMNPSQLRSSIHSAFIPIQGSHHDVRYVTPIKPVVTLPNNSIDQSSVPIGADSSGNLFIDANQPITGADIQMISPRSADPPSYEVAIKQLQKSSPPKDAKLNQAQPAEVLNKIETVKEQVPNFDQQQANFDQQQALLGSMVSEQSAESLGPFAQKLMKLSQQTQIVGGKDIRTVLRNELINSNNSTSLGTSIGNPLIQSGNELSNVSTSINDGQSNISTTDTNPNGANLDFTYSGDMNMYTNNQLIKNTPLNPRQPDYVLKQSSALKSVLTNSTTYPDHSILISNQTSDNVLNLDPSFHLSSHFGTANQNEALSSHFGSANQNEALSSVHNHESANLNLIETSQLLNKPDFSLPRELNETQKFQVTNTDIGMFNNDGAYSRTENTNTIKNLLIGGKLAGEDLAMVVENGQNKQDEITQQELIDDIGLPWESLREIEGDLGDFNMFN